MPLDFKRDCNGKPTAQRGLVMESGAIGGGMQFSTFPKNHNDLNQKFFIRKALPLLLCCASPAIRLLWLRLRARCYWVYLTEFSAGNLLSGTGLSEELLFLRFEKEIFKGL
jgi:hypothetical protein